MLRFPSGSSQRQHSRCTLGAGAPTVAGHWLGTHGAFRSSSKQLSLQAIGCHRDEMQPDEEGGGWGPGPRFRITATHLPPLAGSPERNVSPPIGTTLVMNSAPGNIQKPLLVGLWAGADLTSRGLRAACARSGVALATTGEQAVLCTRPYPDNHECYDDRGVYFTVSYIVSLVSERFDVRWIVCVCSGRSPQAWHCCMDN